MPEKEFSPEREKEIETKIILEFMRHSEKKERDETEWDKDVLLTEKGRAMAREKGRQLSPQRQVSLAWGSPRKRTQETALRVILADIDRNMTLEEIKEIISEEQKVGGKFIEDKRLDCDISGPEGKEMYETSGTGSTLRYLVEKSDRRAVELHDTHSATYSRFAGNIAEIILRYSEIGNNFNSIASNKKDYEKFGNQLERYLATHQGVVEGFIAKLLEETQGIEKRNEFINSLGNGFKETEGIRVEVVNKGTEQKIIVDFKINDKAESLEINRDLIEKIIRERNDFERRISGKKE